MKKLQVYFQKIKSERTGKSFIFLICVAISTCLWFANSLTKQFETSINIPVEYTGFPSDKTLINTPPSKLQLRITGHGFTILRNRLGLSFSPIVLDIEQMGQNKILNNKAEYCDIATDRCIAYISNQLDEEIKVANIQPDTITLHFDQIKSVKKPIVAQLDLKFEKEYFQSGEIHFIPDSATVTGPAHIVDTISQIKSLPIQMEGIKTSIEKKIGLEKQSKNIKVEPRKAQVNIPVSQFTEYSEKVKIMTINLPDSLELVTFPGKVSISCMVALNEYKNLAPSSFFFCVDYAELNESSKLKVKNIKSPDHIEMLKFQPEEVEYIISSKRK